MIRRLKVGPARELLAAIARCPYVIVRLLYVLILRGQQLLDRRGQLLLKCILVSLLGSIFASLRCLKESVIAAAEVCLDVAPGAMKSAADASALFRIMIPC